MDERTLQAYAAGAASLSARYRQVTPADLHRLILTFFHGEAPTADIGCGSGRDTDWLGRQGFQTTGYDASPAMLAEARRHYPGVQFAQGALPDLEQLADEAFANVLCSAVLMHLPGEDLITAAINLARVLRPGGRIVLSVRASKGGQDREPDGRLFTPIPGGKLKLLLESVGLQVLHHATQADASRPDVSWTVIAAEKSPSSAARGLERIQSVLVRDRKVATYKFALIRALCAVSRTAQHLVRWGDGEVYVPLWSLAVQWLVYYWPFLSERELIAQKSGEQGEGAKQILFRGQIRELAGRYGSGGLYALLRQLDEDPRPFLPCLRQIAAAIRLGPVQHAGTNAPRLFRHVRQLPPGLSPAGLERQFGWVAVPEQIWLDISRFDVWIEDSLILRWAALTAQLNPGSEASDWVPRLLSRPAAERDTREIREVLSTSAGSLHCVWSGNRLHSQYAVDHVIPYSAWGNNDWWNLLPTSPALNSRKSDALPTRHLLLRQRDLIADYWQRYRRHAPVLFGRQVERALGTGVEAPGWEALAFAGLQENVERVALIRGLDRWEP